MAFVSSLTRSCALTHPSLPPSLLFPCSLAHPPPFSFLFFSFHLLLCLIHSPFLFFLYALLVHVFFVVLFFSFLFFSFPLKKNPSLKILEKHIMRSISTLPLQVNLKSDLGVVHV